MARSTGTTTVRHLRDLVAKVEHAYGAVTLTDDGLVQEAHGLAKEDAEQAAAVAQGMWSLGRGTGHRFDGGDVRQIAVEMDTAWLLITGIEELRLAVLALEGVDAGLLTFEAATAVKGIHTSRQLPPAAS